MILADLALEQLHTYLRSDDDVEPSKVPSSSPQTGSTRIAVYDHDEDGDAGCTRAPHSWSLSFSGLPPNANARAPRAPQAATTARPSDTSTS